MASNLSMGTIRKIGEDYFIEFHARGLLYQQKAGKDEKTAEKLLKEVEGKIAKGELLTVVRQLHLDSFWASFSQESADKYPPATQQRFQKLIAHFDRYLKNHEPELQYLSQITPLVIERYRTHLIKSELPGSVRKHNPKTVNLTLLLLKEILEHGIRTGFIHDNPTLHIHLLPVPAVRDIAATPETIKRILRQGDLVLNLAIPFILETGLRIRELTELTWSQVNWSKPCLQIPRKWGGNPWREVPLSMNATALLKEQAERAPGGLAHVFLDASSLPLEIRQFSQHLESVQDHSGIPVLKGFHFFRNTFAIKSLKRGLSLCRLADILGVEDIAKMMTYAPWIPVNSYEVKNEFELR